MTCNMVRQRSEWLTSVERFAKEYAERSGVTVEWLKEHGREARECDCEEEGCEGWQMAYVDNFEHMIVYDL